MPISVQQAKVETAQAQKSSLSAGILGKDEFLKLLVAQLRFQDPLSPMKGTEFAAQLAQFSSVEQLANINSNLQSSLDANSVLTQSINNALAATLIGKNVRAATNSFQYNGTGSAQLGYSLPLSADSVVVKVYNSAGTLVKTIQRVGGRAGENEFAWDGTDQNGNAAASGRYTFSVEAKNGQGQPITASQYILGTITGVRYKAEGTVFVIDGAEVSLSHILEITMR